jgi:Zn2+/Cd2+-exporting ATPase
MMKDDKIIHGKANNGATVNGSVGIPGDAVRRQSSSTPSGRQHNARGEDAHEHDAHSHDGHSHDGHGHEGHSHDAGPDNWKAHWDLISAFLILALILIMRYGFEMSLPGTASLVINAIAYMLAGRSVISLAFRKVSRGDIFNEFVLMTVATVGAFIIGEFEEGVAVMVFYQIGEWFQDSAVNRAKTSIKALLDIRPDMATVVRGGKSLTVPPGEIAVGEIIEMKPGEKLALDGELISANGSFNTAALTGESTPDSRTAGATVYAGMINLGTVSQVRVQSLFKDSKLSGILAMVQDATARKSQTQLFISRFAKVYTPIVFFLALAVCLGPVLFVDDYVFKVWFYRALVFLVISCPCALVVSIPLGYFGGIGLASRNGLLFKGGNFLDVMAKADTIVMDKTGTLTEGVFAVRKIMPVTKSENDFIELVAAIESKSTHPVAKAVVQYADQRRIAPGGEYPSGKVANDVMIPPVKVSDVQEIAGHGMKAKVNGQEVLVGNLKLLEQHSVQFPAELNENVETVLVVAIDGRYEGYLTIADEVKPDAAAAVAGMHKLGLKTVMLSGDKDAVVARVARQLGIDTAFGSLLPENKVEQVQKLKDQGRKIVFVGDGVNDAPVIALADAGIAMGGLGSDAAIETADIVIQNDQPSKIVSAIKVGKITRSVVWQNITIAMIVKLVVLALGAGGIATLWEAVIADVGVALLAILNATRIQYKRL